MYILIAINVGMVFACVVLSNLNWHKSIELIKGIYELIDRGGEQVMDFDDLPDDIRDVIYEDIKEYNTEVDDLIFEIARREKYDEDGDIIE